MIRGHIALAALTCVVLAACGTKPPAPSDSPTPTGTPLAQTELKLRVLDALPGTVDWCDPDSYPVAHGTPLENAKQALPGMQKDRETYDAILDHFGIPRDAELSDRELLRVYEAYKLVAHEAPLALTADDDLFRFEVVVRQAGADYADKVLGNVTSDGNVTIDQVIEGDGSTKNFEPNCPICLARNTRIAVPGGFVRVQDVRVGMTVWTTDRSGQRIRATVLAVGRTPVPSTHEVVRLVLADGRTVLVSPGHPTPAETPVGDVRAGQPFEGSTVVSAERIPYAGGFTFDLLPSGPTGTYFANGVLLGSTLERTAVGASSSSRAR